MPVFTHIDFDHHEQVVFGHDPASGLKAIIAVHDTTLGPALGGCRMWNYASDEEALRDVLRLARGMTYKSALARLPLGGGKAVIIGDRAAARARRCSRPWATSSTSSAGATSPPPTRAPAWPRCRSWPSAPATWPAPASARPSTAAAATAILAIHRLRGIRRYPRGGAPSPRAR